MAITTEALTETDRKFDRYAEEPPPIFTIDSLNWKSKGSGSFSGCLNLI